MEEEIVNILINQLSERQGEAIIKDLIFESGLSKQEVMRAILVLKDAEIVTASDEQRIVLKKKLTPYDIARAAAFGIDVTDFSFFKFKEADKAKAIELAKNGEALKRIEMVKRKPLLLKRDYLTVESNDLVYEKLMLIFESSNTMLYSHLEFLAGRDKKLESLLNLHKEAELSIRKYINGK